jgi:cadmium resistance protein CadD (predicted permease)
VSDSNSQFTIGITGHRDLLADEISTIKQNLHQEFTLLKEKFAHTQITMLSGMAEGADQIAVEVALNCGFSVEALLPMPLSIYKDDFNEQSLAKLEEMISHERVMISESSFSKSFDNESLKVQANRNHCYAELGKELIARSHLLLCVWDGKNAAEEGGTSDVLLRYLKSGKFDDGIKDISINDSAEIIPDYNNKVVLWQPVNRKKDASRSCVDLDTKILIANFSPHDLVHISDFPEKFIQRLSEIDSYNAGYQKLSAADKNVYDNQLTTSIDWVTGIEKQQLSSMDKAFVKADNLAMYYQRFSDRQFKLFAYMAAAMGVCFLVYAKIIAAKIFIILYASLFIGGLFIYKLNAKHHWFKGHLTSRIIAETLRVKIFITVATVEDKLPIDKLFKLSGVETFSGFNWISGVFRPLNFNANKYSSSTQESALNYVTVHWVEEQAKYFSRKSILLSKQHHKLEKIKQWLLAGSFVAALLLIFFKESLVSTIIAGDFSSKSLLVFLMGLLPLLLGIWELFQGKMAIKELNWQYKNQAILFNQALFRIKHSYTLQAKKKILFELAERCLMENYLWSIHRYHREHEPPSAG